MLLAWITAALTFVLILVTGFYAWANYRVMRIMQADVRARTEPIPRIGIQFSEEPRQLAVEVRVEHAPMRLISLSIALIPKNGRLSWTDCIIGDPRTISPDTPAVFVSTHRLRSAPEEWRALIHYTDLGEALKYTMKLSSKGFSLVQAQAPPGPISTFLKRISETIDEVDVPSDEREG
jgi:hypothetical protein